MAVSNNDRISSAGLLDVLKGLQADGHLGSEPEVVTETETHESIVLFQEGENSLGVVYGKSLPLEGIPYYAYNAPITYNGQTITAPSIDGLEPVATLNVVNHYEWEQDGVSLEMYAITDFELTGSPSTDNDFFDQLEDKYVFFWSPAGGGMRAFFYGAPDFTNLSNMVVGKTTEYTTTTTTKTKHTIKQDYVPNADWNQNDPDADGYVEGRTHWVEQNKDTSAITIEQPNAMGNLSVGSCDKFGGVSGFEYPNGKYEPNRTGEIVCDEEGGSVYFSYVGEDAKGEAIIVSTFDDVMTALQNTSIGILMFEQQGRVMCYIAYPNANVGDVCTGYIISEDVHKLDRKFYDYTEPIDIDQYAKISTLNQYATKGELDEYAKKDTVVNKRGVLLPSWNDAYRNGIRGNGFTIKLKTNDGGWISDAEFSENNFITHNVIDALYNHSYYKPNNGGFTDANYNVLLWLVRTYGCTVNGVRYSPDSEECQSTMRFDGTYFNVNGTGTPNAEMTIYVNRVAYNSIFNQNSKPTEVKSTVGKTIVNDCTIFLERILRTTYNLCGIECYLSLKYNSTLWFNNDFVLIYNMPMLSPTATANTNIGVLDETVTMGNNQIQIVAGLDKSFGGTRNTFAVFARVLGAKEDLPTDRVTEKVLLTNLTNSVPSALENYFQGK